MKRIMILIIASLMIASPVYALQQIAGPLTISIPIGGTDSVKYGLINDENETITVSLRAEGDVEKYLSFPATVELPTNVIVYTDITAKIPSDYKSSGNITGYLYALQEGEPGTVRVNIQLKKFVNILIPGLESTTIENPQTVEQALPTEEQTKEATVPLTGFFALVSPELFMFITSLVLFVILIIFIFKRRRR